MGYGDDMRRAVERSVDRYIEETFEMVKRGVDVNGIEGEGVEWGDVGGPEGEPVLSLSVNLFREVGSVVQRMHEYAVAHCVGLRRSAVLFWASLRAVLTPHTRIRTLRPRPRLPNNIPPRQHRTAESATRDHPPGSSRESSATIPGVLHGTDGSSRRGVRAAGRGGDSRW